MILKMYGLDWSEGTLGAFGLGLSGLLCFLLGDLGMRMAGGIFLSTFFMVDIWLGNNFGIGIWVNG